MLDPVIGPIIAAGANLLGGLFGQSATARANEQNIALQREFAQNAVRWKVEDAKAAGVSPLYALGAPTMSFSPSVVGDTSMPAAMSAIGQDISRAVEAGSTAGERVYNDQVKRLTLQRMDLENRLLGAQIVQTNRVGTSVGFPSASGSDTVSIASPFGLPSMQVANPELAQEAESHFGDMMNEIYGVLNWLDTFHRNLAAPGAEAANILYPGGPG